MNSNRLIKGTYIVLILILGISMAYAAPPDKVQDNTDRFVVQFDSHQAKDLSLIQRYRGQVTGGEEVDIIPVLYAELPQEAIEGLENNPHVVSVEKDVRAKTLAQSTPWGISRVNADDVHSTNKGSSETDVSIIDTGVDYNHPDLANNYVDGYDFVNGDSDPMDDNGHGTHVAGTAAAVDNNEGVIGAAPEADLYGVKVLASDGYGYYSDIISGIDWSVKGPNGVEGDSDDAEVISMSLGGESGTSSLQDAVQNAESKGTLVVAAAGNDGSGDDTVRYPAKYDSVIAVAATDSNNDRASFSSTGPDVELSAPGVNTLSTLLGGDYGYKSGTSMATPHVSGVAALVFNSEVPSDYDADNDGNWDAEEVRKKMDDTAVDLGADGRDDYYGYGLVNATAAVGNSPATENHDLAVTSVSSPSTVTEGETVTVEVTVENQGDYSENSTLKLTDLYDEVEIGSKSVSLESGGSQTYSFSWDTTGEDAGDHELRAEIATVSGESDTSDNTGSSITTVETQVHDLATTGFETPSAVEAGETATLNVTVENLGDYDENATVEVVDFYDDQQIGSKEVLLSSGSSTTVNLEWDTSGESEGDHTLEARVSTSSEESDTTNNDKTSTVTVENPVHDVATVSVSGSDVTRGETASVDVTVENQGDYDESFDVVLRTDATTDSTDDDYSIGTKTAQLSPSSQTTLTFNWDTTNASTGSHNLTATSGPVTNESDTSDNSASTTLVVQEQIHDLAVTAVDSPSTITESETATVDVTVENQGDYPESTTLTLTDLDDGESLGSKSISLDSGHTTTYSFNWDTTGEEAGDHTLEAESEPVSGESDTSDNTGSSTTTVEARVHDLAVTSVDSPSTVTGGDQTTVDVTVENQGDYSESSTVTLTDTYDGQEIGSTLLTISAGSSQTFSFEWNTTGEEAGDHTLEAEVSAVENETETSDNTGSSITTVEEPVQEPVMYVQSVDLEVNQKGRNYDARAYVQIVDNSGNAVKQATVSGDFEYNGDIFTSASGNTNGQGEAKIDSGKRKASGGDTFGFTVTDVQHPDYVYDSSLNLESSETQTVSQSGKFNLFSQFF